MKRAEWEENRAELLAESKIPKVFCDAESLILCLPFGQSNHPPSTRLLYATWQDNAVRQVRNVLAAMPVESDEYEDEDETGQAAQATLRPRRISTVVVVRANGRVFGGFCDDPWDVSGANLGSSRCFLFSSALDIKIPFQGRKTLPPPTQQQQSDDMSDDEDNQDAPQFSACRCDNKTMQFGVGDLVLTGNLSACSSQLENTFCLGVKPGSDEANTLLAGSSVFKVDELELWAVEYD